MRSIMTAMLLCGLLLVVASPGGAADTDAAVSTSVAHDTMDLEMALDLQNATLAKMRDHLTRIEAQMAEAQASLEDEVVSVSVGGGAITIEMTGAQELRSITIQPDVVDPEDVEMLQDLLMAAFNEALTKSQQLAADKLGPLTGGVDIPGLF